MKLLTRLSAFLFLLIIQSCSTKSSQQQSDTSKIKATATLKGNSSNGSFQIFLKKFNVLKLPLTIPTLEIAVDSSKKLTVSDNDFLKCEYPDEIYSYGILPDTTNNYKIIWLEPTEIEVPVLTTFTKEGKKIDQEELGVGGCGSDCGFKCEEYVTLNKDMTIFSVDSEKITPCDTNGNFIGREKRSIRYKKGKILPSGKIIMSEILEKSLD